MKKNESKTLSVSAIKNGTVIDHIPCGMALKILQRLNLMKDKAQVTLGLHLKSSKMRYKDIIKIEDRHMTASEAGQIAILAPTATINIIQNYRVIKKLQVAFPEKIVGLISCPNPRCITNHEAVPTFFFVSDNGKAAELKCKYCEKVFAQEDTRGC